MEYITIKRYKRKCLAGRVNLPYGTVCEEKDKVIFEKSKGTPLCLTTSQDAYDFFSRNDDGHGAERGALVNNILHLLSVDPANPIHQKRWDRIWGTPSLEKFRRKEHADFWVWNNAFYNAEIPDLEKILNMVKGA